MKTSVIWQWFTRPILLAFIGRLGLALLGALDLDPTNWLVRQVVAVPGQEWVEVARWGLLAVVSAAVLVGYDWWRRTRARTVREHESTDLPASIVIQQQPLPEQQPANYEAWDHVDYFPIWQAACLFAGIEPFEILAITQGTQAYPFYSMLLREVQHRSIRPSREESDMRYSDLARRDLIDLARRKGLRAPFLFPEERPGASRPAQSEDMIPLSEFARLAYETTRHGVVGKAASMGAKDESILTWYAYYLINKYQIYGEHPPSRITELANLKCYHFANENGEIIAREISGSRRWINLRIRRSDMVSALSGLDQLNSELAEPRDQ